jgi:hypothetical protein
MNATRPQEIAAGCEAGGVAYRLNRVACGEPLALLFRLGLKAKGK